MSVPAAQMRGLRVVPLTAAAAGMTRMRSRGGASPDTLYDLTNGYVSPSKAPTRRPGTFFIATIPSGTKGLMAFKNQLHVFTAGTNGDATSITELAPPSPSVATATSGGTLPAATYSYRVSTKYVYGETLASTAVTVTSTGTTSKNTISWSAVAGATGYIVYGRKGGIERRLAITGSTSFVDDGSIIPTVLPSTVNSGFVIDVLRHPDSAFSGRINIIHFAAPFLGYPYVVAEFDDGQIFHYWLRTPQTWLASHQYLVNDIVQPSSPNGYYYQATAAINPPAWAPSVARAVDDAVQPTVANGWKYTVTAVTGDNPQSSTTEPNWPKTDGATVTEFVEAAPPPLPPAAPPAPAPPLPPGYSNPGGPIPPTGISTGPGGGGGRQPTRVN